MKVLGQFWKQTRGQDLAEYGIALSVIGSIVVTVAYIIRVEVFFLWLRPMFRLLRVVGTG
jgi:hypothetical protein